MRWRKRNRREIKDEEYRRRTRGRKLRQNERRSWGRGENDDYK
jgi:hypothetical protein